MKELRRWLTQQARRHQTRPELFEALLTGRYAPYAFHRLRFMAPRLTLRLLTQFFEVFVLSSVLPWEYFVPLLSYRASSALIAGTYWGALEELRTRVRTAAKKRHYETARIAIESWLGVSLLMALACLLGIATWTRYGPDPSEEAGFSLFDAYAVACFARLALDLITRTYHAGIFALSRVYRPVATLVLPDLFELGFIILGWNQLGPWGIAASILLAGALRSFWSYYYAFRAYGHSRIPRPKLRGAWRARRAISLAGLGRSALHALANGSSQIDSLLILALAHAPPLDTGQVPLAVVYYVLRPLMSAAHGWTRVFYFDWKRLETGLGRVFQPRMRAMLGRIAFAVVVGVGIVLSAVGYGLWREHGLWSLAALIPLFIARTAFSLEQLEAFSLGQYARLARLSVLVVLAIVVLSRIHMGERELLLGAAGVLLGSVLWSMRWRGTYVDPTLPSVGLAAWLTRLSAATEPVRVYGLCADRHVAGADRLARSLTSCFAGSQIARAGRAHVIAFDPLPRAVLRSEIVKASGGALRDLTVNDAVDGRNAVLQLVASGWFERTLELDLSIRGATREELISAFRSQVPNGYLLELDVARGGTGGSELPWAARRSVLREIASRASGRRPRSQAASPFRIAVLASRATAQVVFVAPRNTPDFARFVRSVEHASLRTVLEPYA